MIFLLSIDCVQMDTGHQFELYNNLNDDWEVIANENDMEEFEEP